MYHSVIDSYSLNNPLLLNDYQAQKVVIDYEPNSTVGKYHHNFFLNIIDEHIDNFVKEISEKILVGWFAFAWNQDKVFIIFNNKVFQMSRNDYSKSQEYKDTQQYGLKNGISREYVDFRKFLDQSMVNFTS